MVNQCVEVDDVDPAIIVDIARDSLCAKIDYPLDRSVCTEETEISAGRQTRLAVLKLPAFQGQASSSEMIRRIYAGWQTCSRSPAGPVQSFESTLGLNRMGIDGMCVLRRSQ